MQRYPGGGIKQKFSKVVEEEYSSKDGFSCKNDSAMFMMKGGDRCISPPKHSSYVHKESYEGYDGGHAKLGHEGFKAHHSESWVEKDNHHNHHDGGWGGNHGGYGGNHGGYGGNHGGYGGNHGGYGGNHGGYGGNHGGYGGNHSGHAEQGGGWGGGHSEHGGQYSSGGGSGGRYGHHYESYKSMGGGPQKGAPLWNFKGLID